MTKNEMREIIDNYVCISQKTVDAIIGINGDTEQTYLDILYYVTGYTSFESFIEEYCEEEVDE